MSALQDPGIFQQTTELVVKNVNSHKNPVLSLKWLPNTIEIDKKHYYNVTTPTGLIKIIFFTIFK